MIWILAAMAIVTLALRWLYSRTEEKSVNARLQYVSRGRLLSPTEQRFFDQIHPALPAEWRLSPKVRLRDVIDAPKGQGAAAVNRIGQKHVDFVLVEASSWRILAVVELDDATHDRADRRKRDQFVDEALQSARIPILHIRVAPGYDALQIVSRLREAVGQRTAA